MEYIQGRNLLAYAEEPGPARGPLDVAERLELIARVCDALQHAHQNGIIHRDLKPDNILVVDSTISAPLMSPSGTRQFTAQPKLLDFGIARALEGDGQLLLRQTGMGQLVGTPAYMSPEQVKGDPSRVDTRSDIYTVGVLLYQLLANRMPYSFGQGSMMEIVRAIEEQPIPPLRTASISRTGRISADIEAIVLKALSKDRDRRYQTAEALASDIRRFLADEPIEAKRDSALYLLRKNVKRYRGALAAAAAFVVLLVVFAVWAAAQARTNRRLADESIAARNDAVAQRDRANQTARRLTVEMAHGNIERGRALTLAGNYLDAGRLIWREFLSSPESRPALWALREFYARFPIAASMRTHIPISRAVAVCADGARLAVSGDSDLIEIWDLRSNRRERVLTGHQGYVVGLAFHPRENQLASAGWDGTVRTWDASSGRPVHVHSAHKPRALDVCYSPDGELLYSVGSDRVLRVWRSASGDQVFGTPPLASALSCLAISADGMRLAVGQSNGAISVFHTAKLGSSDWEPVVLKGHRDLIECVAFSRDGEWLASSASAQDRAVKLWRMKTGTCEATLTPSVGAIESLLFSHDGRILYGGGWFTIDAWDVRRRERIDRISKGKCSGLAFSGQGRKLIGVTMNDVRMWDLSTSAVLERLGPQSGRSVAFDPLGRFLATVQEDGSVELRDPITWTVCSHLSARHVNNPNDPRLYRVRAVCFNPGGSKVVSVSRDRVLHQWDVGTGKSLNQIEGVNFLTHQAVAFSPDGAYWALARNHAAFNVFPIGEDVPTATLAAGGYEALSILFSPDGRMLATTGREHGARLWSLDGRLLHKLECAAPTWCLAFSPDGSKLLSGTWGSTIEVWDVNSGRHERSMEGHNATVWGLQFKPDDPDVLASCSSDGTVRFWSLSTGRNLATLDTCGANEAIAASFSPDGELFAVACSNHEVCVWKFAAMDERILGNLPYHLEQFEQTEGAHINPEDVRRQLNAPNSNTQSLGRNVIAN